MRGAKGLRELLGQPGIIVAPGAYDAVSARLVERAGFKAVYVGSYATAAALTSGSAGVNLIPIQIGAVLNGNVFSSPHQGQALALGMFVLLAATMLIYVPLQRRSSRWSK